MQSNVAVVKTIKTNKPAAPAPAAKAAYKGKQWQRTDNKRIIH
jgi:hypothetical protein